PPPPPPPPPPADSPASPSSSTKPPEFIPPPFPIKPPPPHARSPKTATTATPPTPALTYPSVPTEELSRTDRSKPCSYDAARAAIRRARRADRLAPGTMLELLKATRADPDCIPPAPWDTGGASVTSATRGRHADDLPPMRNEQGVPTLANPTTSLALPGAVPVGVPNFFIDKFRLPVFLLPIYQAAGIEYGVRWEVLAAINEIETDYGRNLNISSAGALGWMQFMPSTWKRYGVDANRDGRKDPFNPVDAIFAAARYLKAAGAEQDLRKAIFAYNHADWYVDSVLMRARLIGGLPTELVGSLSALTQGHFPVYAKARYADDISERHATRRVARGHNAAMPVESSRTRRGIDIFAAAGSPVIAVQDGRIVSVGHSKRLGRFVRLVDAFGNVYTYARLKTVAARVPVPKPRRQSRASILRELALPKGDPKPTRAATAGRPTKRRPTLVAPALGRPSGVPRQLDVVAKERLFAHPERANPMRYGGARQLAELASSLDPGQTLKSYLTGAFTLDEKDVVLKPLVKGRRVVAGTILGRIGTLSKKSSPHVHFEIRPSGRGAPRIDPKPILDGWKLLEATSIYRARGENALAGVNDSSASIGQVMLMSKEALMRRVLSDPRIEIYSCGRQDIEAGGIDRRVLATLEFLAASGLKPTVTSLHCGHSFLTASGNVSEHSAGSAVDIARINGISILGHQGDGSITDLTIRRLLTLQGTMKPHQIISLMTYAGADNTLALPDHADHIHVGFRPQYAPGTPEAKELASVLKPTQWVKLIDRLGEIDNPDVTTKPSRYAIRVPVPRASAAHDGE
ncbi:MAG: hypothetical protein QOI73_1085, partial [Solirubrobacteraceae bacterium]|nr:hypothetical protein [Solirubrobacteraceae bacterium]